MSINGRLGLRPHEQSLLRHTKPHKRQKPTVMMWAMLLWLTCSVVYIRSLLVLKSKQQRLPEQSTTPDGPLAAPDVIVDLSVTPKATSPSPSVLSAEPPPADKRVSGLGPPLDAATLHGGWTLTQEIYDHAVGLENATVIHWESPRIILFRNFLSQEEIDHILTAAAELERSEVVSDGATEDQARTSYGAWLNGGRRTPVVQQVQHRIYQATQIPEEFAESLYLLRYALGQEYKAHTDQCSHGATNETLTESCKVFLKRAGGPACGPGGGGVTCGDRLATFILYLQSPKRGGATVFPYAKRSNTEAARSRLLLRPNAATTTASSTAAQGEGASGEAMPWYCQEDADVLKVLPSPGDAVIFWDYVPGDGLDGLARSDHTSLHAGCPPLEGTKFIATRWMRAAEFH